MSDIFGSRSRRSALVALTVMVTGACAGSSAPKVASATTTTAAVERVTLDQQQIVVRGRANVMGQITLEAKDNYFTPNLLTATPGATIKLHVVNNGAALHNISITEQSINHDLAPKEAFDVDVKVPASGQLIFFCRIHREETGMVGVINQ